MTWFRRLLHRPHAAAWLVAATLLMKLMVPAGFMPVAHHGSVTLMPCSGIQQPRMAMSAGHGEHGDHGKPDSHHQGQPPTPCDFSVLAGPGLAGAEPFALAEPLRFTELLTQHAPTRILLAERPYLRPPLRGPPAI